MGIETPVLQVKDLATAFIVNKKRLDAVADVSFDVRPGRMTGIVGESGCGKSVTANTILRLLPKNAVYGSSSQVLYRRKDGTIVDLSKIKNNSKEIRRIRGEEIGMVFQDPMSSLNPVHTIGAQVSEKLLAHNRKMKKAEARERVVEMLSLLGIPMAGQRFNDYPHQFSGGMKQRVMIALAMINNPNLLIADEPTTALDVTIQAQIMELMTALKNKSNTAIMLITHNMGIVAEAADDIAVMYLGRIVEKGSVRQVFENPCHPYTKALLRSVPVLGVKKGKRLESIRGSTPDLMNVPKGCSFGPRCDEFKPECAEGIPDMITVEEGHCARCIHCKGDINI